VKINKTEKKVKNEIIKIEKIKAEKMMKIEKRLKIEKKVKTEKQKKHEKKIKIEIKKPEKNENLEKINFQNSKKIF